jgi:hypothetical protein
MPNRDGTGPEGQGPRTGRQMGKCDDAKPVERGFGRRAGCGRGCGRGFGRGFGFNSPVVLTKDQEKKILEAELQEMDLEKQEVENRLKELK